MINVVNHIVFIVFTSYWNDPSTLSAPLPWLMIITFKLINSLVLGSCCILIIIFLILISLLFFIYSQTRRQLLLQTSAVSLRH